MSIKIQIGIIVQSPCAWYLLILSPFLYLRHSNRIMDNLAGKRMGEYAVLYDGRHVGNRRNVVQFHYIAAIHSLSSSAVSCLMQHLMPLLIIMSSYPVKYIYKGLQLYSIELNLHKLHSAGIERRSRCLPAGRQERDAMGSDRVSVRASAPARRQEPPLQAIFRPKKHV